MYETLVTSEEMAKLSIWATTTVFLATTAIPNYDKFFCEGSHEVEQVEEYHSHNTGRLDVEGMKEQLMRLRFIQEDLGLLASEGRDIRSE